MTSADANNPVRESWLLVDGQWLDTGTWAEVRSPYSGQVVSRVGQGGAELATAAVDAAERAMREPLPAYERAAILDRAAALVRERRTEFATAISQEAGKPISNARIETDRAASTLTFAAAEARKLTGEMVPMDAGPAGIGKLAFTLAVPIGIVGAISPFNFPLNLVAHKLAPAIAAGCAVVLKPAGQTPSPAMLLAQAFMDAGLPAGWVNVIAGPSAPIGAVLTDDERVKLISFTGSAQVGWRLAAQGARKRVKLELGNAAPVIVRADADLSVAARKIAGAAFSYAGQSCISVQRVYVERAVFAQFTEMFVPLVKALNVGDPSLDDTEVGPVIDTTNRDRILEWIHTSGGKVLIGGNLTDDGLIQPTVIQSPSPDAKVSTEEVFGPVCTLSPFDTFDEALTLANSTRLGLQAGIFTNDYRHALRAAAELEFGSVLVNEVPTWRTDQMPYGGVKDSGNTKEGPAYTIRDMVEHRLVVLDL